MTTANAVTGTTGQILLAGIDTHSPTVQLEVNYNDVFRIISKNKDDWKKCNAG